MLCACRSLLAWGPAPRGWSSARRQRRRNDLRPRARSAARLSAGQRKRQRGRRALHARRRRVQRTPLCSAPATQSSASAEWRPLRLHFGGTQPQHQHTRSLARADHAAVRLERHLLQLHEHRATTAARTSACRAAPASTSRSAGGDAERPESRPAPSVAGRLVGRASSGSWRRSSSSRSRSRGCPSSRWCRRCRCTARRRAQALPPRQTILLVPASAVTRRGAGRGARAFDVAAVAAAAHRPLAGARSPSR